MTDDELMKRLGVVAREQQQLDCLGALAAGDLPPQQTEELRQMADSSAEAASCYEAHRPLDPLFRGRLLQCAQADLGLASGSEREVERTPRSGTRRSDAASAPDSAECRWRSRRRPA